MIPARALLAAVLVGGALVLVGGVEPGDRLAAGIVALIAAGALVGVNVITAVRLSILRRRRERPPE